MNDFKAHLNKVLGKDPSDLEMSVFAPFDPNLADRVKLFSHYYPSRPLFLNIDDEHYVYISNHTNHLRCCLDMATRQLDVSSCYQHEHGTIMLGIAKPENEKHLNSRHVNYHIYIQHVSAHAASESLTAISQYTDHITLIRDESPWERLCRVCVETKTGAHITASSKRLFKMYEDGLIYIVPDHLHHQFNKTGEKLDSAPVFIGKTVPYPILSLDNEKGLLEIPLATLRELQQEQLRSGAARQPVEPDNDEIDILSDLNDAPDMVNDVFKQVQQEINACPPKVLSFGDEVPELRIDALPLKGLSYSKNGIELHVLTNIVNLLIKGFDPIALSYYLESTADIPQEIETYLAVIKKSAKLFDIPIANNCIVPGKENRFKLFLISKKQDQTLPYAFQQQGDFICLLGDPNGTLKGSACAFSQNIIEPYTPPGVMSGTLVSLVDVINECREKGILSSAAMISRGGLVQTLNKATENGLGASIYSERKGPAQLFIFGEPPAAAMVTIRERHLIDLARITSNYNLTSTTIGRVTDNPEIKINNDVLISPKDKND
jgi:selenophosphate synthetase-related protein